MKKLFLIDAYALIYRSYYAFIKAPRINSKGLNTSAILGFVNVLEDILKREDPTHIAVVLIHRDLRSGIKHMKTTRHNANQHPKTLKLPYRHIKEILAAYNIPFLKFLAMKRMM